MIKFYKKAVALTMAMAAVIGVNSKIVKPDIKPQAVVAASATVYEMKELLPPVPMPAKQEGVLIPSGYTAEELAAGLNGALKEYAWCFVKAEEETGINAAFLASVAALESGWASSGLAVNRNNLFGWTAQGSYMRFSSKEECISYVARCIKELYLTPGGRYFNGYYISDINVRYNGRPVWESTVEGIMSQIVRKTENNRQNSI